MTVTRSNKSVTKMQSKIKEGTKLANEEINTCMDPVYKIFLQHLKVDGTSYILQMKRKDKNAHVFIKYEGKPADSQKTKSKIKMKSPKESKETAEVESESEEENLNDESYEMFLNNIKIRDEHVVLDLGSEGCFVYEKEEEEEEEKDSEDDDEVLVIESERDIVPYSNPDDPNENNNNKNNKNEKERCLTFEEKMKEAIAGPFDPFEYAALMDEASHRKPLMKQRNLRGMSKRYKTSQVGSSYFDHYPDLKNQISQASSNYERLILLRKFFFWLENLCHEGAYMPWMPKALTVQPILEEEHENVLPIAAATNENET